MMETPFFVPHLELSSGGLDFLGLQQANIEMMDYCLPGINNTTWHIRPYSLMSWVFWKVAQLAATRDEIIGSKEILAYQERVETLFTWGHQLRGSSEITVPGRTTTPPESDGGLISLSFASWRRQRQNTSLLAAVTYGPSLKAPLGLGMLEPLSAGVFRTCGPGVRMAEALDEILRQSDYYEVLDTLEPRLGSEAMATDLYQFWRIDHPSPQESRAFQGALLQTPDRAENLRNERRSATLELIREVVGRGPEAMTLESLRETMTLAVQADGQPLQLEGRLASAQRRWLLLQLRQAQRLALESLLTWVEQRVIKDRHRTSEDLLESAMGELEAEGLHAATLDESRRIILDDSKVTSSERLQAARLGEGAPRLFELIGANQRAIQTRDNIVPTAFRSLVTVDWILIPLVEEGVETDLLTLGRSQRISLDHFRRVMANYRPRPLRDFVLMLLENFVLSQHLATAVGRFDGVNQRLRLSIEEEGLVPLVQSPWSSGIGPDRLATAISLMSECGLVNKDGRLFRRASE